MIYSWSGSLSWTINHSDLSGAGKGDKMTQEGRVGWGLGTPLPGVRLQVLHLYPWLCGKLTAQCFRLLVTGRKVRATEADGGAVTEMQQPGLSGLFLKKVPRISGCELLEA